MPLLTEHPFRISYGANDDRLNDFYVPALGASVRFDRTTGFFSSAALAMAAAGVARLIANGGHMRLLCGAQLSAEDVDAIRRGEDLAAKVSDAMVGCLADPDDQSMAARLEALAWMVANDMLEIRVVLPKGPDGAPLPADQAREYYHPKEGLFEDRNGNRLAFSGSSNDSANGWLWNYETFMVYGTFPLGGASAALPAYVRQVEVRFERLWQGREQDWIAIPIPQAAREGLLAYCPDKAPTTDPLERPTRAVPIEGGEQAERVLFEFLRAAPLLSGADGLGVATSNVTPWPHQTRVVDQVVSRYPENFLFCDEVGLGKTIEAGLALRELVLSGRVKKALILVPKSVLRQWQEELWEKFLLNVPRYDGGEVRDVFDRELTWSGDGVWDAFPILLASSQLAKRRERQPHVAACGPWDLVIIDEAHHARRKDFLSKQYRPNRLLELLMGTEQQPGLKERTRCIYLMTATPMQVDPVEVWDLLKVLGLGGRWGAYDGNFLRYFSELRKPWSARDWAFLLGMLSDSLHIGGGVDHKFAADAEARIGIVDWQTIRELPFSTKVKTTIDGLGTESHAVLEALLQTHTPLRSMMWRSTRRLLRKYRELGLLKANVPTRKPENVWIELRDGPNGERELYDRIDEYISDFYQKYEAERKGLGFIMTVYRRRLTSSFYALQCSLERRLDFLRGAVGLNKIVNDDDLEQDDLDLDVTEQLAEEGRAKFAGELEYVEGFVHDLRNLPSDSKLERLHAELQDVFAKRDKVLVFTQYTDTMDHVREQLQTVYGSQVACYSGRGGERWDGVAWMPRTKEEIKTAFREGDDVRILLCTESASEGLNLQTCGVLINYDMPWNPMRVEQRIGRIDRIGQRHPVVWVSNYFYAETVEAEVYRRLSDRIGWFQDVVGELQPILQQVAGTIQRVAMLTGEERRRSLDEAVKEIRRSLDEQDLQGLDLDVFTALDAIAADERATPVTLKELQEALLGSATLDHRFSPDEARAGVYRLSWGDEIADVTFDPEVFDQHPNTVQLLTYGNPLLEELLAAVAPPAASDDSGVGFFTAGGPAQAALVAIPKDSGAEDVGTLAQLKQLLELGGLDAAWSEGAVGQAAARLSRHHGSILAKERRVQEARLTSELLAIRERARMILVKTALLKLAEQQAGGMLGDEPILGFGPDAVEALRDAEVPYPGLWKIAESSQLRADATDPYFAEVSGLPAKSLIARRAGLKQEGMRLLRRYVKLRQDMEDLAQFDNSAEQGTIEASFYCAGATDSRSV